jgi:replicative DNA helicase
MSSPQLIEEIVLNTIIENPKYIKIITKTLNENDFENENNKQIFNKICELQTKYSNIDKYIIGEKIDISKLTKMSNIESLDAYIKSLKEKNAKKQFEKLSKKIFENIKDKDIEDTIYKLEESLREIKTGLITNNTNTNEKNIQLLQDYWDNKIESIKTGFDEIDTKFPHLLEKSNLIVVAARPSLGKSALTQQIAENIAKEKHALIVNLEMSSFELMQRYLSRKTGIKDIKKATEKEKQLILKENEESYNKLKLTIIDNKYFFNDIINSIRIIHDKNPIHICVIDYLQIMKLKDKSNNATSELEKMTRELKLLAKELNIPIILISQLNRDLESRVNKRPMIFDLKGSGAIEQDADSIIFIYRDAVYNKNTTKQNEAEIIIAKNRHGETDTVCIEFEQNKMFISNKKN